MYVTLLQLPVTFKTLTLSTLTAACVDLSDADCFQVKLLATCLWNKLCVYVSSLLRIHAQAHCVAL